jgi:outer membrane protein assembly factor BamB
MHEGGPGATPTVDQDRVYTHGREGQLQCLGIDNGEVIWSISLQQELGVDLPEWGFSSSPLVVGDALLVEAGRVVALNKYTGKKIWQTAKYHVGYGSPSTFTIENEVMVAVLNNDFLLVLRAEDGSEVAKKKWETSYKTNSTTPIVSDGHIFISSGYNKGCALLRLAGTELDFVYDNKEMRNHFNNCVLWKGHLYGIDGQTSSSRNCKVVCMDWSTGEVQWTHRGLGAGSLFVADGKLVIFSDQGQLVLAEVDPSQYTELGSIQVLEGKCWTVPILAGGRIYCRNATGDIVCVDVRSKE